VIDLVCFIYVYIYKQISNGCVRCVHSRVNISLDAIPVNDGLWHYIQVQWILGELVVNLDYGDVVVRISLFISYFQAIIFFGNDRHHHFTLTFNDVFTLIAVNT